MCEGSVGVAEVEIRLEMGVLMGDTAGEMDEVVGVGRLFIWLEGGVLYSIGDGVKAQRVGDGVGGKGIDVGIEE